MKYLTILLIVLFAVGCGKKIVPAASNNSNTNNPTKPTNNPAAVVPSTVPLPADTLNNKKADTVVVAAPKPMPFVTPPFIVVNDAVAKKSVDGRLYYDLKGKRYWKNYRDGKYYLFNKDMNANPDFKPKN